MQLKMNRQDYVTENLVNIRDRLRENTAAKGFQVAQDAAIRETTAAEQLAVPEPAAVPAPASATSFRQKRQEEGDRMRRDLELRLAHDLAELEVSCKISYSYAYILIYFLGLSKRTLFFVEARIFSLIPSQSPLASILRNSLNSFIKESIS